jgi:hypothetical protein
MAEELSKDPEIYPGAKRCMVVTPRLRQRSVVAFRK